MLLFNDLDLILKIRQCPLILLVSIFMQLLEIECTKENLLYSTVFSIYNYKLSQIQKDGFRKMRKIYNEVEWENIAIAVKERSKELGEEAIIIYIQPQINPYTVTKATIRE